MLLRCHGCDQFFEEDELVLRGEYQLCKKCKGKTMNEQQVLDHLNQQISQPLMRERGRIGDRLAELIAGGIGKQIIDALKSLVGTVDVGTAIAAAKKFFDAWAASNSLPAFVDSIIWMAIESLIRRLFVPPATSILPPGAQP
jgi:hypothetical protein